MTWLHLLPPPQKKPKPTLRPGGRDALSPPSRRRGTRPFPHPKFPKGMTVTLPLSPSSTGGQDRMTVKLPPPTPRSHGDGGDKRYLPPRAQQERG